MRRLLELRFLLALGSIVLAGVAATPTGAARAAVGDLVATAALPVPGGDVGIAFDGTRLYYNDAPGTNLLVSFEPGNPFGTRMAVVVTVGGDIPIDLDAMAYDATRDLLWAVRYQTEEIYRVDKASGLATFAFDLSGLCARCTGSFKDGLAFDAGDPRDPADDTLWWSYDLDWEVYQVDLAGKVLDVFDVRGPDAVAGTSDDIHPSLSECGNSGIAVGGRNLYLGTDGCDTIVRVDVATKQFVDVLARPQSRPEDLECDPVSFAPREVMWVRQFEDSARVAAYEIEPATCGLGGGEVEVDHFPRSRALVAVRTPLGLESLVLTGPTTVLVDINDVRDSDRDGREQVQTEMTELELRGVGTLVGPVVLRLRDPAQAPFMRSTGEIEETENTQEGRLDLPPFAPEGSADSFFDVFFEVEVGGQVFHTEQATRMESVIHHKPPGPGTAYRKVEGEIPLFDENGRPADVTLVAASHVPRPIEVDFFPDTRASIELVSPSGASELVELRGPTTVEVDLAALGDPDRDEREQVPTEIVAMELSGESRFGPIVMRQSTRIPSRGEIEETVNTQEGRLDLPPFAPEGTADSFFDVFFEIEVQALGGLRLHNREPKQLSTLITHKPPADGEAYETVNPIELFDENGNPSGFVIGAGRHMPDPIEVDHFDDTHAVLEVTTPDGTTDVVTVRGPTTVEVDLWSLGDPDGNGREQVPTEIVAMELRGESDAFGSVVMRQSAQIPSRGEIEETVNTQSGRLDLPPFAPEGSADSFFDVFFDLEILGGLVLHNEDPKVLRTRITHKPPAGGEAYETIEKIELFFENGEPSGIVIGAGRHMPDPIEVDEFPTTLGVAEVICPNFEEVVALSGPTTVHVDLGAIGDPDGNTREQVPTEIVALQLTGVGPTIGAVTMRQSPTRPSLGEIEETTNTQTGRLDLPPFAPSGTADSFFDVFFEIEILGGLVLHNETPKRLRTRISHKPPLEGDVYEDLAEIALFDENGNATGCVLGASRHAPACPDDRDTDQDEVPDACDNCTLVPNTDQRDTNGDGYGNICDPDLNDDGLVGIPDFNMLRSVFGQVVGDPLFDPDADFNGDGGVGIPDFNVLRSFFGLPPGPSGLAP
ncbi:MAG: hypothetical protein QNK03_12890 [Myxococcota bacterium]|nr:hypothetical protein [Myxococcota bacterium]